MHPHELVGVRGNINPRLESETRGIDWLFRIQDHFDRAAWLNPDPESGWENTQTTRAIKTIFPMFHLSVDGIERAIGALVGARRAA